MSDPILDDLADGVFTITLHRPDKLNALTDTMLHALLGALERAERDQAARCVVVIGAGRGFCAGQDLGDVRTREPGLGFRDHLERTYNKVIRRLRAMEKPVVAGVNGVAAGAGASLALACDLRLAAEGASFIQSFSRVGLVPDSGSTWLLPRLVGYARAYELAVTAAPLDAAHALSMGVVNQVLPAEGFAEAVHDYAARLAAGPTRAFGLTKRAMNRAFESTLDGALSYEARLQEIAGRSSDHLEGVTAFLEKRAPRFEGR